MADPENSDSPQVKLFRESALGFETRDLDLLAKTLHNDFRYVAYPKSLGHPDQTKEQWLERCAGIFSVWTVGPKVSYIGCSLAPFAATKPLPQPTYRFIVDTPGKVVVHVRVQNA